MKYLILPKSYLIFILVLLTNDTFSGLAQNTYNENTTTIKYYQNNDDTEFEEGSKVLISNLTEETIIRLDLLGRVWGFLKYYHPSITSGKYNWDFELFRFLPNYIKANSNTERNELLSNWILSFGEVPKCKNCTKPEKDVLLKPNLDWIENFDLNTTLKNKLYYIYNNRNLKDNHYVSLNEYIFNSNFDKEAAYTNMTFPDTGYRLLALYRYWNIIEYFFPYKHLTDKKWETTLKSYIPLFIKAKDELEYELAVLKIIGEVNDTHANLWKGGDKIQELRGSFYTPFKVEFVQNKLVVVDYFNPEFQPQAKLTIGDVITHINGKKVESLVDSLKQYYPASNNAAMLRNLSIDLVRSASDYLELNYLSDNLELKNTVKLYHKDSLKMYRWNKTNENEKCYKLLDNNIGYITLATIKDADIPNIKQEFINTTGIIIDIRNYPSTFVPFLLGSYFIDKPVEFTNFTIPSIATPGEFKFIKGPYIFSDNNKYKGKLIVLVNENSQSQSEYTTMAFRATPNCTIIGSTTAGADGNVSQITLPGGIVTVISGIGIYYPDKSETQRIGIVPDTEIQPTIEGIKNGRDEVLEKAIELILK